MAVEFLVVIGAAVFGAVVGHFWINAKIEKAFATVKTDLEAALAKIEAKLPEVKL